jgi:uncharacterized membrane protein (UPF0127 family)
MSTRLVFSAAAVVCLFPFAAASAPGAGAAAKMPLATVVIDSSHGPVRFQAELAADPASQEKGLMFRTKLAADAGMLFDFHAPDLQTFWMKNTVIPLDMIFIRADGMISSIAANATPYSLTPIPSHEPVLAVLEINGGRAAELGIEPGGRVHNAIVGNALPGQK